MIRIEVRYDPKKVDSIVRAAIRAEFPSIVRRQLYDHDSEIRGWGRSLLEAHPVSEEQEDCPALVISVRATESDSRRQRVGSSASLAEQLKVILPEGFCEKNEVYVQLTLEPNPLVRVR